MQINSRLFSYVFASMAGVAMLLIVCLPLGNKKEALLTMLSPAQVMQTGAVNHNKKLRVAIVMYGDDNYLKKFASAVHSHRCYAKRHGYDLIVENKGTGGGYFRKMRAVLKHFDSYDVIVGSDVDVFVANHSKRIEEFLDDKHDVYLHGRFYNAEIAASLWTVRVTNFSRNFLQKWLAYDGISHLNFDNEAIHIHVARTILKQGTYARKAAENVWSQFTNKSRDWNAYFDAVYGIRSILMSAKNDRNNINVEEAKRIKLSPSLHGIGRHIENHVLRHPNNSALRHPNCHTGGQFWCKFLGNELFAHSKGPDDYVMRDRHGDMICPKATSDGPISKNLNKFSSLNEARDSIYQASQESYVSDKVNAIYLSVCFPNCPPIFQGGDFV